MIGDSVGLEDTEMYAYAGVSRFAGHDSAVAGVLFPSGELYTMYGDSLARATGEFSTVEREVGSAESFDALRTDVTAVESDPVNPSGSPATRLLRVSFDSDQTRVDIEGWLMGFGVQFKPGGTCVLHWYRDAYPEQDRLDHPHVSLYGSLADVEQGTGGDVEQIGVVEAAQS